MAKKTLHKINAVDIDELIMAPAKIVRRIPHIVKAEARLIIKEILHHHNKAKGDDALRLEKLILILPKMLWLAP